MPASCERPFGEQPPCLRLYVTQRPQGVKLSYIIRTAPRGKDMEAPSGSLRQPHVQGGQLFGKARDTIEDDGIAAPEDAPEVSVALRVEADAEDIDPPAAEFAHCVARILDEVLRVGYVDVGRFAIGDEQHELAVVGRGASRHPAWRIAAPIRVDSSARSPASREIASRSKGASKSFTRV